MEVSGQLHAEADLPLEKRANSTHWVGGWVGPRADLVKRPQRVTDHLHSRNAEVKNA